MSHALSIYVKPKDKEVKPLYLFYYTGSSNIYQIFRENGKDFFCGNGEEELYKELTRDILNELIADVESDIKKFNIRIDLASKCTVSNEVFEELVSTKEYINELEETKEDLGFLLNLVNECNFNDNIIMYNSY